MYSNVRLNNTTQTQQPQETGPTSPRPQIQPQNRSPSPSLLQDGLTVRTNSPGSNTDLRPRQPLPSPSGRSSPPPLTPATPNEVASSAPQPSTSTQPAAPTSPSTTVAQQPMKLDVPEAKGGNDKQWFPDGTGQAGWLQARDDGKAAAVRREVETIKKLADLGFPVAQIIDRPPPESLAIAGEPKPVQTTGGGVWLANVDAVATKKPKILGNALAGQSQAQRLLNGLRREGVDLNALANNLEKLLPRMDELCKHVGEVDLAFTKDGKITIMDVAPADGGQVAADEHGGPEQIKTGMQRLLQLVKTAAQPSS